MFAGLHWDEDETHFDRRAVARMRVIRRAVEISLVISALVLTGLLRSAPFFSPAPGDGCEHLGRAGEICPQPNAKEEERRAREKGCVFLGRAGRHCPDAEP